MLRVFSGPEAGEAMTDYPITRIPHAAHTGPGTGWDLEQITLDDTTLDDVNRPPKYLPGGFTFHSGYRDAENRQHWIYYRKAPLSPGTCERCIIDDEKMGAMVKP